MAYEPRLLCHMRRGGGRHIERERGVCVCYLFLNISLHILMNWESKTNIGDRQAHALGARKGVSMTWEMSLAINVPINVYIYIYIHLAVGSFATAMFSVFGKIAPKRPETAVPSIFLNKRHWDCSPRPFSWFLWVSKLIFVAYLAKRSFKSQKC